MLQILSGGTVARVVKGVLANGYAQVVTIGLQLASMPLFLSQWDALRYGTWLMLAAVPTYFAMSDFGFMAAASNRIAILWAQDKRDEAIALFAAAARFAARVAAVVVPLFLCAVLAAGFFVSKPHGDWLALALLLTCALLTMAMGVFHGPYRSHGEYGVITFWLNTIRLCEWLGGIAGLLLDGSFLVVAAGMLGARIFVSVLLWRRTRWRFPEFFRRQAVAGETHIRPLLVPALGFAAFPVATAISGQGLILVVGAVIGPAAVVTFSAYRTLSNALVQLTALLSHAAWPEFSRLYAGKKRAELLSLFTTLYVICAVGGLIAVVVFWVFGANLVDWWTHGHVESAPVLFIMLLGAALVASWAHIPRVLLLATNNHGSLAVLWLLIAACTVAGSSVLAKTWGVDGIGGAVLVAETVMLGICVSQVTRLMSADNWRPATTSGASVSA